MEQTKIIEELTRIFKSVFRDENIVLHRDMTAKDVDSWDSLTHMLLITQVEEHFGIKITLKELNKLKNVGALIDLMEIKTA
jgi:acyl carrier protein